MYHLSGVEWNGMGRGDYTTDTTAMDAMTDAWDMWGGSWVGLIAGKLGEVQRGEGT